MVVDWVSFERSQFAEAVVFIGGAEIEPRAASIVSIQQYLDRDIRLATLLGINAWVSAWWDSVLKICDLIHFAISLVCCMATREGKSNSSHINELTNFWLAPLLLVSEWLKAGDTINWNRCIEQRQKRHTYRQNKSTRQLSSMESWPDMNDYHSNLVRNAWQIFMYRRDVPKIISQETHLCC